jgi:N-dimethylarginine dimethylaminohydrolase
MRSANKACFLMCPPQHFAVTYTINPWMDPSGWSKNAGLLTATAQREWEKLRNSLRDLGATVELVAPLPGMPDMVFTANSAVVLDRKALLARFRHAERQLEQPQFAQAFHALHARGVIDSVHTLPADLVLEGAGDCVWDRTRDLFWMGYGQRSDVAARDAIANLFGVETVSLELVDPRFYHLDTALSPLPNGEVMYLPSAFAAVGRNAIADRVAPADRIEVTIDDACRLAANAVAIEDTLLMSSCSDHLHGELRERGYRVVETPLTSFLRSGGAAFCLTLRLDQQSTCAATRQKLGVAALA